MSFILLFLFFSQALSQTLSCLFTPAGTGLTYDLQALFRPSALGDYQGSDGTNTYLMNVCGFVQSGGTCTAGYGALCAYDSNNNFLAELASYAGSPRWTWDLISPASPSTGVKITYLNGDNCTSTQMPYSVVMSFYCQPDAAFDPAFTITKTDDCSYALSINSPNACPEDSQVLRLISGEVVTPASPQTAGQGFNYWSIDIDGSDAQLNVTTVQLAGANTTLEVYIRANAKPTAQTFDRRDVSSSSIHMIQIRTDDPPQDYPLAPGNYYIGVRAYGPNAVNYTLQATNYPCLGNCSGHGVCNAQTHVCTCDPEYVTNEPDCSALIMDINNNQPVTGLILEDGFQYWRFDDTDANAYQFFINMARSPWDGGDALPTLMIRKNDFPTLTENDGLIRDFSIPSQSWALEINGSLLTSGFWIIGVQGSPDTDFMYSLTASIYDCDRNCSNHGTCNPATHVCTCDPNWATDDCSLSQMNLPFNMWTQQSIGPDSIGYFVAGVPDELADRPVDLLVRVKADSNLGSDYYPRIYIGDNQEPNDNTYTVTSAMPPAPDQQLRVSYTLLSPGEWFIGIVNLAPATANVQILLSFEGQCLPGNCSGHGSCNLTVCSCNDGWEGGACDVETQGSSSNVATGTVVALVFVFLILGTAVGILVMRQWPQLCSKSSRESLVDTDES